VSARPPRLAGWLLRTLLPRAREADVIRGDLIEEFRRRASRSGSRHARAWFYREALSSIFQTYRYRRMLTLDRLRQDIRDAYRGAVRRPGFTALVVFTLALGIGASTAIFSIVNGVLLRPLPLPDPDRLLWINEANQRGNTISVSWVNYLDWRARVHSFETLGASRPVTFGLTGVGPARRIEGRTVTSNFFTALGTQPVLGRGFNDADQQPGAPAVAIVSHELWQRQLNGDPSVVGRTLMLSATPYTIVGVMPAGFRYLRPYDLFVAMGPIAGADWLKDRGNHQGFVVIGRLRDGVTVDAASRELRDIENNIVRENAASAAGLSVVTERLASRLVKPIRDTLLVLFGAVGILLVVACMNVAGLLLARGAARQHELAVRAALGGGRLRLATQLLVESTLLSASGGVLGVLLASALLRALVAAAPPGTPRLDEVSLDATAVVFAALAATACGVLFGLVPAFQASSVSGQQVVVRTRGAGAAAASHRLRRGLLAVEVALALVLLAGAGLMARTLARLTSVDLGFTIDHVLSARLEIPEATPDEARRVATMETILTRVSAIPGVVSAAAGYSVPIDGSNWNSVFWPHDKPIPPTNDQLPAAGMIPVTPSYFETLGAHLVRGRAFSSADRAGAAPVVIVNETLASRIWPGQDPIGKRVKQGFPANPGAWLEVVGVVADLKFEGIVEGITMQVYMPYAQHSTSDFTLLARTAVDPRSLASAVQEAVGSVNRDMPLAGLGPMEVMLNESIARQRMARLVLGVFAIVALALASIGLFGLVAHAVTERRHEVGVRMALGATRAGIVRLLVTGGVTTAVLGAAAGVGLALALTKSLAGLLFGVEPFDPLTFGAVMTVLLAVATLACAIPAYRATRVGIITALRAD
jgi:putative ABC transport system permease protein